MLKFRVDPAQTGLLEDAVGVPGGAETITLTVPGALGHPLTVTTKVYVPEFAVVAFVIVGFCVVDVKPLGPLQLYVAFAIVFEVRVMLDPVQTGLLDEVAGVAGVGFTITVVVAAALGQPLTVIVTEYVPAFEVVAFVIEGF